MPIQKQPQNTGTHQRANNSLLIQFLLFELEYAWNYVVEYKNLVENIRLTPHKKYTKKDRELLEEAERYIIELAGSTHQSMRIFTWNLNEGTVAKLKQYAAYFANNLDKQDADAIQLVRHTERAWSNCLECLDLTREQLALPTKEPANITTLIRISEKLFVRLQKLAEALAHILPQFRDDENVLYFLLKHQDALAKLWEKDFLPHLFKKLFPNGKEEVECFLKSRYDKRHFSELVPDLTQKIYTLMAHV
jgi:hypothetical protein